MIKVFNWTMTFQYQMKGLIAISEEAGSDADYFRFICYDFIAISMAIYFFKYLFILLAQIFMSKSLFFYLPLNHLK